MALMTQTVTLQIDFDPEEYIAPELWDWPILLDTAEAISVVGASPVVAACDSPGPDCVLHNGTCD